MKNLEELKKEVALAIVNYNSQKVNEFSIVRSFKARYGHFEIDEGPLKKFLESEKTKGYELKDMCIKTKNYDPYSNTGVVIENIYSKNWYYVNFKFHSIENMRKKDVIAMNEYVKKQRKKITYANRYLLYEKEAQIFIKSGKFYENNLDKMGIDKETHDFLLNVKTNLENEEKIKNLEAENSNLRNRIKELSSINE